MAVRGSSRHRTSDNDRYIKHSLFTCGDQFGSSINMKAAAARFAQTEQYDPNVRIYEGFKVGSRWIFKPTAWRKGDNRIVIPLAHLAQEHFDRLGGALD